MNGFIWIYFKLDCLMNGFFKSRFEKKKNVAIVSFPVSGAMLVHRIESRYIG